MTTMINRINLSESLMFLCMKKNQLHPFLLFIDNSKILQFDILGTLEIPIYDQQKWYSQLIEDFGVYLHVKFLFIPYLLQRYCNLAILGTLGIPGHAHHNHSTTL